MLHPEETVTTLLLIRHGHTVHTETGKVYSDPCATLTDKGREEARAIAKWLPCEKPQVLLSSPSVRVRATAEMIADIVRVDVEVVPFLKEWQVGSWDGRSYVEIKKDEPEIYASWSKDPIRNAPPGGESIEALCIRAQAHVAEICELHAGKRVALVTHAEVIRAILVAFLGMPVDNFYRLNVPTASVSKIDISASWATLQYLALRPELSSVLA